MHRVKEQNRNTKIKYKAHIKKVQEANILILTVILRLFVLSEQQVYIYNKRVFNLFLIVWVIKKNVFLFRPGTFHPTFTITQKYVSVEEF